MLARICKMLAFTAWVGTGCGHHDDANSVDAAVKAIDAAPSPDAPGSQAGSTAIPLTSLGGAYSAKIKLGGQPFDVVIDTGSSSTAVAAATCTNCNTHPLYTPGSATDTHQTASASYGSGSWKGEIYEDSAVMGNRAGVTLDFGAITSQMTFFPPQAPDAFQGILGLGPDGLLLPHTTSYLSKLIGGGMLGEFAFQLCPDGGTLWLGGYDPAAAAAPPAFTPLSSVAPYYIVNIGTAAVSGSASLTGSDFGPTIIDNGTTQTFVPAAVLTSVTTSIKSAAGYAAAFGTQALVGGVNLTTTKTSAQLDAALPPLSLSFAGATTPISIPATRSYLLQTGNSSYQFMFADSSQLFGSGTGAPQKVSLFGNSLLAGLLTVIDIDHKQIGFAAQKGCGAASLAPQRMVVRPPRIDPATVAAIVQAAQP